MRNFNENTITDAALERIKGATDPRVKQVSEALVRHLRAFVREVPPTQKEWEYGIDFLTRTGHICDDKRQEFILLSAIDTSTATWCSASRTARSESSSVTRPAVRRMVAWWTATISISTTISA